MQTGQRSIQAYLIARSQAGDRKAQSELYKLYASAMYNVCRRMMGDDEDAKDVLQDSFVDAFMKLRSLKEPATFPAWMKRITVNHCINALKKRKKMVLEDTAEAGDPLTESWNGIEEDSQLKIKRIMSALDEISEGCRTVFNLYLFEGYDHKEIGEILSISESASKAQYSKAKMKIRNLLDK